MFKIITDDNLLHVREGITTPFFPPYMAMMNLEFASRYLGWVFTLNMLYNKHFLHISHISFWVVSFAPYKYFSVMLLNVSLTKFLSSFLARCGLGHGDWQVSRKRKELCHKFKVQLINLFYCSSWLIFRSCF